MLPSLDKGGNCVAHGFNCTPLTRLPNMCLADALVFVLYQLGLTVCRQAATVTMVIGQHAVYAGKSIPVPCKIGISHKSIIKMLLQGINDWTVFSSSFFYNF